MLREAHHLVAPATAVTKFSNDGFPHVYTLFYEGSFKARKHTSTEKEELNQETTENQKKKPHKHGTAEGQKKSPPGIGSKLFLCVQAEKEPHDFVFVIYVHGGQGIRREERTKITSWRTEKDGLDVYTLVAAKPVVSPRGSFAVASKNGTLAAREERDTRARGGITLLISSSCCKAAIAANYHPEKPNWRGGSDRWRSDVSCKCIELVTANWQLLFSFIANIVCFFLFFHDFVVF